MRDPWRHAPLMCTMTSVLARPYDRAVEAAEAFIRSTWKVRGIVVAGSIVRGEGDPASDLDIVVIHAEAWRVRDQRRFEGVPAELFVNPPDRIRGYFASEHAAGRPSMANMLATGIVLEGAGAADPIVAELVGEAREWLARPIAITPAELTARRYAAVDLLDDARDMAKVDPASAQILVSAAVQQIVAYAFWKRAMFQPRRKDLIRALATIDPVAADQVRAFTSARGDEAMALAVSLARHVLGVDTFFEWTSDRS